MDRPRGGDSQAENNPNGARLNNGRERFVKINAWLLRVTAAHPASLVARKRTVRVKFMTENPLARDDIGTRWARNKRPCVVENESVVLLLHGLEPVWIKESSLVGHGYGGNR